MSVFPRIVVVMAFFHGRFHPVPQSSAFRMGFFLIRTLKETMKWFLISIDQGNLETTNKRSGGFSQISDNSRIVASMAATQGVLAPTLNAIRRSFLAVLCL
jgi:hypothetical protein